MSATQQLVTPDAAPIAWRPTLRYLLLVAILMGLAYGLVYFPYPAGSLPVRALSAYLRLVTRVSGTVIGIFDPSARVGGDGGELGDLIQGRSALRIVLDCAALEAHMLFIAAVVAFPVGWRRRVAGVLAGSVVVALVNVARIVTLYIVGLRWPAAFHVLHEEVLQLGIVLATLLAFCTWIAWARRPPR